MKLTERKKLIIYKALALAFAFVIAFMPATASRNTEVNSRVIVEMLGIDGGDELELTAQYAAPTGADGAPTKDKVSVKAATLTQAVEQLSTALGRRAELGHCSVVVVGSELEPSVLGTLMTATDVTADVYLTAAEDKAKDLVGDITEFMKKTGATDADFIAYSAKTANIATTTLLNFLSDINSASHTAFMPVVEMIEEEGGGEQDSSGGSGGSAGSGESQGGSGGGQKQKTGMKVEKLALYNGDGRAAVLAGPAARGVAWVSAPIEKGVIICDVEHDGRLIKDVSAQLKKKRAGIAAGESSVKIMLSATLKANGDKFNEIKVGDGDAIAAVKNAFSKAIESDIRVAYDTALSVGCDPLFIGRQLYRYEPKRFDGFRFGDLPVEIVVDVMLK